MTYPRLWDSPPNGVTHIAGDCLVICNIFMRQRCSWCGIILLEYDLRLVAGLVGQDPLPGRWTPGVFVRVDGHVSAVIEDPQTIDGDVQLPTDCCTFDPKTQVGVNLNLNWRKAPVGVFPVPSDHGDVHTLQVARSNGDSLTVAEYKAIFEFVTGHPIDPTHLEVDSALFDKADR